MPLIAYLLKIDREKWESFKEAARDQGYTMKWLIEQWIDDYLRQQRKPSPKKDKKKS